jgi:hypothetical protein
MAWSDKFSHPITWGQRELDTLQDVWLFIQRLRHHKHRFRLGGKLMSY